MRGDSYPDAGPLAGADYVDVWQSGKLRRTTLALVAALAAASVTATATSAATAAASTRTGLNILDFGGKGDGVSDETAAFASALAAVTLAAKPHLIIPAGYWMLSSPLSVTMAGLRIEGAGSQATVLQMNVGSANILNWSATNAQLEGVTLSYGVTPDVTAVALNTSSAYGRFRNVGFFNCGTAIKCSGAGISQTFSQIAVVGYTGSAIWVAGVGDVYISEFVFVAGGTEGDATKGQNGGIRITDTVEAFNASMGEVYLGAYGLFATSTVQGRGNCPAFCTFTQVYFDSTANLPAALNNTILFKFTNCWFSGGRSVGSPAFGCQTINCVDTTFVGCEFINNGSHGLVLQTGTVGTRVIGCTFDSNGAKVAAGAASGIAVIGGVTDFIVTGCNFSNGIIPTANGGGQQGYAVSVAAGASDRYQVFGNLMTGNFNAEPIIDQGSGVKKVIRDNAGSGVMAGAFFGGTLTLSAAPTTAAISAGSYAVVKNTTDATVKLWANDGGTMKSVALA